MSDTSKGNWYKLLLQKVDKSIKNEYYLESLFVEYMIIDDRVKTLCELARIPLTYRGGKPKQLGALVTELKNYVARDGHNKWLLLNNPIEIMEYTKVRALFDGDNSFDSLKQVYLSPITLIFYTNDSSESVTSLYAGSSQSILSQLEHWKTERNHWMHSAGDDNFTEQEYRTRIIPLALDGASFCREFCDITTKIKRSIR